MGDLSQRLYNEIVGIQYGVEGGSLRMEGKDPLRLLLPAFRERRHTHSSYIRNPALQTGFLRS